MPSLAPCSLCFGMTGSCSCPAPNIRYVDQTPIQRPLPASGLRPEPEVRRVTLSGPRQAPMAPLAPTTQTTRLGSPRQAQEALLAATDPMLRRSRSRGASVGAPSGIPGRPIARNPGHLWDGADSQDGVVLGSISNPQEIRDTVVRRRTEAGSHHQNIMDNNFFEGDWQEPRENRGGRVPIRSSVPSPDVYDVLLDDDSI